MTLSETIPGMKPESTGRNVAVGVGYGLVILVGGIPLLALLIMASPLIAAVAVGKNYKGAAEKLSGLPGIDPDAGLQSGVVAFVSVVLLLSIVGAVAPADDSEGTTESAATPTPTPDNVEQTQTETQTQTAEPTTQTETDTPTETPTATPPPTPSESEIETEVRQSVKDGLSDSDSWSDGARSIEYGEPTQGTVSVRYDLDTSTPFSSFTAKKAERRAGFTARSVIRELMENENVDEIAIYAYVPVQSGSDSVSTKVVITREEAESINWDACAWQCLRSDADQYKFNEYLY